jgi:serine/threonine protein kinase
MSACDLSDSVRIAADAVACEECGSTSRVGRGYCLNCLLHQGLGCETETIETLDELLDEVDVRDADWRIGNYQILEEIGRGGMGVIYRARQRHSRRIVALKRILSYQADSQETLVRFRREAEAAASLDHPNILPIYEVSESEDGLPFFSMKFAAGGSLQETGPTLRNEPRRSVALMAKVARAVQYAHLQGILHRDLKPGNVLLDGRGEPLVSDFGLAKWLDTNSDLTRTLTIFGTPGYIAPEQAKRSAAKLTPAADVYSLGAILFDLFTGRPPFLGEHALAVIQQAAEKPAPKLRSLISGFDRDLETICAKCLQREPQARYRSAGNLAEDLERWLEGRSIIARPVSPPVRIWRWSKRNPILAGSIAACVLLGGIAGAFKIQNRIAARVTAIAMHSVAVEPLLDLDTAQPDSKLSGDIAAALQNELSKHGPARVTAVSDNATTSTSSGSSDEDAKARWQGARTALQGTKRIRDGKLRVSLRLINTSDGKVLYRKIVDDLPDLAVNITAPLIGSSIYRILNLADLTSAESKEVDPAWRDQSTRELLITARAVMQRRTVLDMDRALELLEKAVKAKPNSALGYSYLAELQSARVAVTGDSRFLTAAAISARTALSLNPKIAETHEALCSVLFEQGRFRESLEEAFIAYELADGDDDRWPSRVAANLEVLGTSTKL